MKRFGMHPLASVICASGLLGVSTHVFGSGFQLWEQDGASVGNYHAGYAAEANDASTAWYNPAGITRFHNQQLVLATTIIVTDFKFKGSVGVTESLLSPRGLVPVTANFDSVTAQGGTFNVVPALQYVAPINDRVGFGFSVGVPFGLKTNYGRKTPMRYAATLTSINIIDISPSLAVRFTDRVSIGAGFDIQRANARFNNVAALISPLDHELLTDFDTLSKNRASDTGYGFHAGILYQFNPCTRVGLSYHSQVVHHFTGHSRFDGPIADLFNDDQPILSGHVNAKVTLPPYTALSAYHELNPCWAVMATIIYTEWSTFNKLIFKNAAGLDLLPGDLVPEPSSVIRVVSPKNYRNTVNVSLGVNYFPTETIILRGGVGYDKTPIRNDRFRDVRLPDSTRYAVAMGAHFQATPCVGFDIGWSHIFARRNFVNAEPLVIGAETVSTSGRVRGGADVLSGQVVWDML